MKCFALCFKRLQNLRNKTSSKDLIQESCDHSQDGKQMKKEEPLEVLIEESKDKCEKQLNPSNTEVPAKSLVNNEDESKEDTFSDYITSSSSFITHPPNHKFNNEKCEDVKLEGSNSVNDANNGGGQSDFNDNGVGDHKGLLQEESSESLFSISLDSKKHACFLDLGDKEVSSPLKKRDHNAVMNPVEGLIQLKAIRTKSLNQTRNENVNMEKQFCIQPNTKENEVAVDASLSSWLLDSEKTQKPKNAVGSSACGYSDNIKSSNRVEHRPILGEICVKEIKQLSNCSSPRGSESCGKNETPKVGTVGSYRKHTWQTTSNSASSSHSRGQGEVKCNSSTFQIRLERALESGVVQVQPAHPPLAV